MPSIDWNKFKCRCSAIGKIMSESRSNPCLTEKQAITLADMEGRVDSLTDRQKIEMVRLQQLRENSTKVVLSDTCIEYLMEVYAWETVGKVAVTKEMDIDFLQKGKLAEDDSLLLLSRVDKHVYVKNTERVSNEYLSGEPDTFLGESIMQATKIPDIKTCWDYPGFLKKIHQRVDVDYKQQIQGYCDITGAAEGEIAYCLVNMPHSMMLDFKKRLFYKGNYVSEESPEFIEKWAKLINSMVFDDIPINQRVHKVPIQPFTETERQKVYDRVKICREWLFIFDESYKKVY
jgi:hypothetical protein